MDDDGDDIKQLIPPDLDFRPLRDAIPLLPEIGKPVSEAQKELWQKLARWEENMLSQPDMAPPPGCGEWTRLFKHLQAFNQGPYFPRFQRPKAVEEMVCLWQVWTRLSEHWNRAQKTAFLEATKYVCSLNDRTMNVPGKHPLLIKPNWSSMNLFAQYPIVWQLILTYGDRTFQISRFAKRLKEELDWYPTSDSRDLPPAEKLEQARTRGSIPQEGLEELGNLGYAGLSLVAKERQIQANERRPREFLSIFDGYQRSEHEDHYNHVAREDNVRYNSKFWEDYFKRTHGRFPKRIREDSPEEETPQAQPKRPRKAARRTTSRGTTSQAAAPATVIQTNPRATRNAAEIRETLNPRVRRVWDKAVEHFTSETAIGLLAHIQRVEKEQLEERNRELEDRIRRLKEALGVFHNSVDDME